MIPQRRRKWILFGILAAGVVFFWQLLPDPLFSAPLSPVLFSRDGQLLGARIAADQQWRFPPAAAVPEKFRQAVVTYEDKRFAYHPGIDPLALLRALRLNLEQGRVVSGGSTLTMQVIRLARGNPARTVGEKVWEMLLAVRLECGYDKEQIFALWAAYAPFGGNVVGVEAASWRYFGRAPAQLSWAEACLLAVLPNNPALVHPGRNRQRLQTVRDRLLHKLHHAGAIDALALRLALLEPLPAEPRAMPQFAPHLLETLRAERGNLRFDSTIDLPLQRHTNAVLARHGQNLAQQGIGNAAAIVIDNRTFEVLAYTGNTSRSKAVDAGADIDLIRRPRSTGSILKPLLYAAMLEDGTLTPTTLIPDLPTQYNGYTPENFDRTYRGAVPAREALARSLNVPAVRMLRTYGVEKFARFLSQLGMTTLQRSAEDYGLTLVLGGAEGNLWELTAMYANLADLARAPGRTDAACYHRPLLLQGESSLTERRAELGPGAAWLTLEALIEVTRPGAEDHWESFNSSQKIAWKTGTSFGLRDGWAIGSTSRYTVGVWVGNANGTGVAGLTGVGTAAPILFELFDLLPPADWFAAPNGDLKSIEVCTDDGYLPNGNCETDETLIPLHSHFGQVTPYHRLVHLDRSGQWRVDAGCERVAGMTGSNWFVLPPGMEYYYRKRHPGYRPLPPIRSDCVSNSEDGSGGPIDLLYPLPGTKVYIPRDLDGQFSRMVCEAVHRESDAVLYWHLDTEYLGTTKVFHQQTILVEPGSHRLTLVDRKGRRIERTFEVLERASAPAAGK